jgi:putative ABC transport system permease protein
MELDGLIIGVAAVILLTSFGIAELPDVAEIVPVVTGSTTGASGQVTRALTASTPGAQYLSATVTGTTANYVTARRQRLVAGAFFNDAQARSGANVAVLGPLIASALYGPDPTVLVGGIGVLNIMLVSVTDRTREIGTRKAVGASDSAILTQFAMEAIALAGVGGLVGVVLGVGLIVVARFAIPLLGATGFLGSFSPVLTGPPIAIAFIISLAIGLIAGGYPAWRAAQLNPIEALRYE